MYEPTKIIKNLMSTSGYSVDEAMKLLLIPEGDKDKYRVIILKRDMKMS